MRALIELALASGRGPVSASLIAKRQDLSVAYLEQLLHRLKRRGIVTSVRGPRGGYVLAKEPQRITMADVVRILDGTNGVMENGKPKHSSPNGKAGGSRGDAKDPHRHAQRIAEAVRRCVHERLAEALGAVTLQDLCDEVRAGAGEPLEHRYEFHI
jgi:Rrf2 family protein